VRNGDQIAITGTVPPGAHYTVEYLVTVNADGERGDSVATNFLLNEGEVPPPGGECTPTEGQLPNCTTTRIDGVLQVQKMGQGLNGVEPMPGAGFEIYPDENGEAGETPLTDPGLEETAATGMFQITGIPTGSYWLREVQAPQGHLLLAEDVAFEVTATGEVVVNGDHPQIEVSDEDGTWRITVTDLEAFSLPMSGGTGSMLWVGGGSLLILAAMTLLVLRTRRTQRERYHNTETS